MLSGSLSCVARSPRVAPGSDTPSPRAPAPRPGASVVVQSPDWRGLDASDAAPLPASPACTIGAFAVYVHPDGAVVPDRVHLVALSSEADPEQLDRMRTWAARSRWRPALDGVGGPVSAWAQIILDCRGGVQMPHAPEPADTDNPIDRAAATAVESQLTASHSARLAAAQLLAASDPRGLDPEDALWHLDAVRAQFATLQSRSPFFYDVLKDELPEELPRAAGEDFWWVRQAVTSHTGMFVFLTSTARVLGVCRYLIGE